MTSARRSASALALVSLAACPAPANSGTPAALAQPRALAPPAPPAAAEPPDRGVPLPHAPGLRASARIPHRATYDPRTLGITAASFGVRLSNDGRTAIPSDRIHLEISAAREDAPVPCRLHAHAGGDAREPAVLDPGQSFTYARDLDCAFALPGTYAVRMRVAIGDGPADDAGSGTIDVVAANAHVPQPLRGHPGLLAIVSGEPLTRPLSPAAWARGDYRVVVGVVNGTAQPIRLEPARVAFDVYRSGTNLRCAGQNEPLALPDTLEAWRAVVVRQPLTCAPSTEGEYVVVGKIAVGRADELEPIGRFDLRVTNDPMMFTPLPERAGPGGPLYDETPRRHP